MLGSFVSAAGLPQQFQADISPVCGEGAPGSLPVEVWDVLLEAFAVCPQFQVTVTHSVC